MIHQHIQQDTGMATDSLFILKQCMVQKAVHSQLLPPHWSLSQVRWKWGKMGGGIGPGLVKCGSQQQQHLPNLMLLSQA